MQSNSRFFNSYKFLRKYYNIPKNIRLRWGIIKETTPNGTEYRLGVKILSTDKYIDIAERRIYSRQKYGAVKRIISEAQRVSQGHEFVYVGAGGYQLVVSKSYIADIYLTSWWSRDVNCQRLY